MADDRDLEKRAVEELLKEANRARVRAETMGPAGWMKCPLRSTNKRFLLNTLCTSGLPKDRHSGPSSGSRNGAAKSRSKSRGRSRTPPGDPRAKVDNTDHRNNNQGLKDRCDKEKKHCYHKKDTVSKTDTKEPLSEESSSSGSRYLSKDCSSSHFSVSSSCSNCQPLSSHSSQCPRQRSRSPVRDTPLGRAHHS